MTSPAQLSIEIVSDVVCPWCYVGKRRLEAALAAFAAKHPDVPAPVLRWRTFQLNPTLPPEGMARSDYLQRKFGHASGGGVYERVSAEGRKEGLAFAFDRIQRQPNTLKAHALVAAAYSAHSGFTANADHAAHLQSAVKEALMQAYFMEGADLTDDAVLLRIATQAGLSQAAASAALQTPALQACAQEDEAMRGLGVTGVPFFIFNQTYAASGAQPAEHLLAAVEQAAGLEVQAAFG